MNAKKTGIAAVFGASLMWAIEPVLVKLAYSNSDFIHTSAIRAIVVSVIALAYAAATNKDGLKVRKTDLSKLVYLAIAGTVMADCLYLYSLTQTAVLNAVLIGHMQPVFIILIGFFILKEDKLTKHDYLGIAIMIIAGILVTSKTVSNLSGLKLGTKGDIYAATATLLWATTAIVMRKYLTGLNAGVITFYRFTFASIMFVAYLLFTSSVSIDNAYQVMVGIVVGVGYLLYYEGLRRIKAAQVSAMELTTPFFAALFGFLFLKEFVTIMQISGIVLLFGGVYFLSRKEEAYF